MYLQILFIFMFVGVLSGCMSAPKPKDEQTLKNLIRDNIEKNSYETAAENYFSLWCQYPNNNKDALLEAAQLYIKADKGLKAIELIEDYIIIRGNDKGRVYLWKALAYYSMVKNPLKNIDKAEKALENLMEYKKYSSNHALPDIKIDLVEVETFLKDIIAAGKMLDADLMIRANPPSLIAAMETARQLMEEYPDTEYAKYAQKIYDVALHNISAN